MVKFVVFPTNSLSSSFITFPLFSRGLALLYLRHPVFWNLPAIKKPLDSEDSSLAYTEATPRPEHGAQQSMGQTMTRNISQLVQTPGISAALSRGCFHLWCPSYPELPSEPGPLSSVFCLKHQSYFCNILSSLAKKIPSYSKHRLCA